MNLSANKQTTPHSLRTLRGSSSIKLFCMLWLCTSMGTGCTSDDPSEPQTDVDDGGTDDAETDALEDHLFELPNGWTRIEGEQLEEYGAPDEDLSDDPLVITDPELREFLREKYEKCEVALDEQGMVRVRCMEEVNTEAVNPCPIGRYNLLTHDPLTLPGDEWSYCLQDEGSAPFINCRNRGCNTGYVCEGSLRNIATEQTADSLAFCVDPAKCLQVAGRLDDPGVAPCFYEDLTLAATSEIPEQDCETLAPHECALNCPCGKEAETCRFLSEQRPVGLCSTISCGKGTDFPCEFSETGVCMHHTESPGWLSEIILEGEDEDGLTLGACATVEDCEAYQERYPGVYTCGYKTN